MKLPALIHDNMVLQQNAEVPVWGAGEPGERIAVTMGDQKVTTTADGGGRWRVTLKPLKAGGPFEMTLSGNQTITLRDVLVGEVWVCSGQSNIAWPVRKSLNAEQEIARADHPMIRLFTVPQTVADRPLQEGQWVPCSPETVGDFSGMSYFFGRDLHRALGVPVGLISSCLGGTRAEVWTSLPALQADPDFRPFLDQWAQAVAECPEVEKIERRAHRQPAGLYQGMIAPLMPYAIQGVIWQQGFSNAGQAYIYRKLFQVLIQEWRRAWGQGDFPFLFVQMPSYPHAQEDATVAELRESQAMALSLPKTGMGVSMDIGEPTGDGLHFKDKQEIGRRLCLMAQAIAYGRDVVYSGPLYESMAVEGNRLRLRFRHADGGLVARGGEPLKGFTVAGPDRKFLWGAETKIEGEELLVWSDGVQNPVAVRYAWGANPVCSLYNRAGLPASTFRTDDWPGVTYDKR